MALRRCRCGASADSCSWPLSIISHSTIYYWGPTDENGQFSRLKDDIAANCLKSQNLVGTPTTEITASGLALWSNRAVALDTPICQYDYCISMLIQGNIFKVSPSRWLWQSGSRREHQSSSFQIYLSLASTVLSPLTLHQQTLDNIFQHRP